MLDACGPPSSACLAPGLSIFLPFLHSTPIRRSSLHVSTGSIRNAPAPGAAAVLDLSRPAIPFQNPFTSSRDVSGILTFHTFARSASGLLAFLPTFPKRGRHSDKLDLLFSGRPARPWPASEKVRRPCWRQFLTLSNRKFHSCGKSGIHEKNQHPASGKKWAIRHNRKAHQVSLRKGRSYSAANWFMVLSSPAAFRAASPEKYSL